MRENKELNISEPTIEDLCSKASKLTAETMRTLIKKMKHSDSSHNQPGGAYSPAMREFSLSLHNISPAAYRYVRRSLDFSLPHESTLHNWMSNVDCTPGFHVQEKELFYLAIKIIFLKSFSHSMTIFVLNL